MFEQSKGHRAHKTLANYQGKCLQRNNYSINASCQVIARLRRLLRSITKSQSVAAALRKELMVAGKTFRSGVLRYD